MIYNKEYILVLYPRNFLSDKDVFGYVNKVTFGKSLGNVRIGAIWGGGKPTL